MLIPRKFLGLIYVAIGIFLASSKDYLESLRPRVRHKQAFS